MTKRTRLRRVPEEFDSVLERAKKEFKALTGKKKCSDADAFRYIGAINSKMFSYNKFDFKKKKSDDKFSFEKEGFK